MMHQSHWHGERKPSSDVPEIGDDPRGVDAPTNTKDEVALTSIVDGVDRGSGVTGTAEADVVNEGTKPVVNPAEASETRSWALYRRKGWQSRFQESLSLVFPNIQL